MRGLTYAVLGALLVLTAIVTLHALAGLDGIVLGFHGTLALTLGIVFTLLLGGGLMFLLFHSARSGHDETVHRGFRRQNEDDG